MAVRATYVANGLPGADFKVGPLMDATDLAIVDEVHQGCRAGTLECREHDDDPRVAHRLAPDGRLHGAWVHVKKLHSHDPDRAQWVIAHSANSALPVQFRNHFVPVNKSPEHQWAQDYFCRAAEDGGFAARQEVVLPSTRLDVQIAGALGPVGIEMQRDAGRTQAVRGRHRKAATAGVPLAWAADVKNPDWAFKVPHFETNEPLSHGHVKRGGWVVTTGTRMLIPVACCQRNSDLLGRCWKAGRRRNWCGDWHAIFRPIGGLVVDDVIQQFAAGDLVELDTRPHRQGIVLVRRDARELWVAEFAGQIPASRRERNRARRCAYDRALEQVEITPACNVAVGDVPPRTCTSCGELKWVVLDGHCFTCRGDLGLTPYALVGGGI